MAQTPRQRRHERTRQAILDAAMQLIAENGPDNLSLRAIARRIDYSPAGLYEYFGSKDAIIDAICYENETRLMNRLQAVPTDLPLEEYLAELGLAYVQYARENPALFVLIFTRMRSGAETLPNPDEELPADESFLVVFAAVQAAIKSGQFNLGEHLDATQIAYGMWSLVHGAAMLQVTFLEHLQFDFEAANRQMMNVFIRGLLKG